jgi:hypothetical protein
MLLGLAAAWLLLNVGVVGWRWASVLTAPIDPAVRITAVDLRQDRAQPGRTVTLIGTRPTPSRGDFIGHMWVAWPQTPPGARPGTREAGFYARDQLQAAGALALALLAPWGPLLGQPPVPGHLKADDGWWRHFQIDVTVDEATYATALAVDARWRAETRYSLRPGLFGLGQTSTVACQDYAQQVAAALGLAVPKTRDWTLFPLGSFRELAEANGLGAWMDGAGSGRAPVASAPSGHPR